MRSLNCTLEHIQNNIRANLLPSSYRVYWRDQYASARHTRAGLEGLRTKRKAIGRELAGYIRDQYASSALQLVNDNNALFGDTSELRDHFESVFGTEITWCEDCSDMVFYDETINAYDEHRICSSCDSDYYYHERSGYYVRNDDENYQDDYDDNDDDDYSGLIGCYHSSRRHLGHIPSSFDTRKPKVFLGLELEMEINSDQSLNDMAETLLDKIGHTKSGHKYALLENDGSLHRGFEMVTGYTGLDVHAEQLAFFQNRFIGAKSHNTSTCGLHVHICKSDMSLLHASKMVLFINDADNHKLVYALARRDASGFAKIHDKVNDKYWLKDALNNDTKARQLRNLNQDRYEALNFQNDKTVEFRLFKGTLKYETLMACLEFTYATWFFCRDTSAKQLTTANFLKYICLENCRKDTRYLRAYLTSKGFSLPFVPKKQTLTTSEEI
jgi:hypothetical protein